LGVLGRQLRNPLLILLLAAAGVSAATGDPVDGAIIAAIVGLSVGLGFINEYRSELAVAALHAGIRHQALVWRDGAAGIVSVDDLPARAWMAGRRWHGNDPGHVSCPLAYVLVGSGHGGWCRQVADRLLTREVRARHIGQ